MSHFAVIAPPLFSHVKAMEALAQRLIQRGHRITFIQQPEAHALLSDSRIGFYAVGEQSHPNGSLARTQQRLANPSGLAIFGMISDLATTTDMLCRELPAALYTLGVDGVIADQMEAAGGLIAEALALPFVSIACALPVNREPELPLPVMPFRYATTKRAQQTFATSERIYDHIMRKHRRVIAYHAQALGLSARDSLHECLSPLAQISQTLTTFDFPRHHLPKGFHAVGPLRSANPPPSPQAPKTLNMSQPFIFASLGTLQGHRLGLFRKIAQACQRLEKPLLVAHCGKLTAKEAAQLEADGATAVTDFVDQPSVLRHAQAVITHGGLNTVIDAIESATPMLVIPLAFDQPGVAARVVHHGIGRRASRFSFSDTLAQHLKVLNSDSRYRQRLIDMQPALRAAGGAERAALIVEQALCEQKAVPAEATA